MKVAPVFNWQKITHTQKSIRPQIRDFGIVIPVKGDFDSVLTCLLSIVAQEGPATVHCHVQDGGENDLLREVVDNFRAMVNPSRILLTYDRRPDSGAADAVNKGMAFLQAEMVSWLGVDDFLMPGALETIQSLRNEHPEVRWLTGQPHVVDFNGVVFPTYASAGVYRQSVGFSSEGLRRGLFAGELNHGWIQQEGTFWEKSLWEQVGGLDSSLGHAFDFDLWSRMAHFSDLVEVVAPLAAFRKRPGQISSDMRGYLKEVGEIRQRAKNLLPRPTGRLVSEVTRVAYKDRNSNKWEILHKGYLLWIPWSYFPEARITGFRHSRFLTIRAIRSMSASSILVRFFLNLLTILRSAFGRSR